MGTWVKGIKRGSVLTQEQASRLQVLQARRLAPHDSGETIRGIRRRRSGRAWKVSSTVSGSFKQNMFANQTAPYRTIHFKARGGHKYYAPNQTVIYGGSAHSRTGNQIMWSARPRFWDKALILVMRRYPAMMRVNTKKQLSVRIG